MRISSTAWQRLAFSAAFVAIGATYWRIPYRALNLPDALLRPGLIVVAVAALALRGSGRASFSRTLLAAGGAVPTAVLARVVMDGVRDPTAHNLWPLEIVIAGLVGLGCALAGALVGSALAATRTGRTSARAGAGS